MVHPSRHSVIFSMELSQLQQSCSSTTCRKALNGPSLNMSADRGKEKQKEKEEVEEDWPSLPLQTPTVMKTLRTVRGSTLVIPFTATKHIIHWQDLPLLTVFHISLPKLYQPHHHSNRFHTTMFTPMGKTYNYGCFFWRIWTTSLVWAAGRTSELLRQLCKKSLICKCIPCISWV